MRGTTTGSTSLEAAVGVGGGTVSDVSAALRVLAQHRRQRYPHGRVCGWCQETYPCTPRRNAIHVLNDAGGSGGLVGAAGGTAVASLDVRGTSDREATDATRTLLTDTRS